MQLVTDLPYGAPTCRAGPRSWLGTNASLHIMSFPSPFPRFCRPFPIYCHLYFHRLNFSPENDMGYTFTKGKLLEGLIIDDGSYVLKADGIDSVTTSPGS